MGKTCEGVLKSWRAEGEHVEGDERFPGLSWKRGDNWDMPGMQEGECPSTHVQSEHSGSLSLHCPK